MKNRYAAVRNWLLAGITLISGMAAAAAFGPVVVPRPMDELVPQMVLHLGKTADWVTLTADAVWVGSTGPFAVHRIDPVRNALVATVKLPGEPCAGITSGFGSLWIPLCGKVTALARVSLESNTLTAVFKVGPAGPEGGVTAGADRVWLVLDRKGTLAGINPVTGRVQTRIHVPRGSYNPFYRDGLLWVTRAEGAEVTAVDPATGRVVSSTHTGPKPRFLTAGDGQVWSLNQGDGSLTQIDAGSGSTIRHVMLGTPGSGGDISLDRRAHV